MFHEIRRVLAEDEGVLEGEVEVDETYIGGKFKNMHKAKQKQFHALGISNKTPVFRMVERGGRVKA